MYIAYTKKIDGLTIITGVDRKQIDQEETKKVIKDLLPETTEFKSIVTLLGKITDFTKINSEILNREKILYKSTDINDFTNQQKKLLDNYRTGILYNRSQIDILKVQLKSLNENLILKKNELLLNNAIYQETAYNQIDISESQYNDFKTKLINIRGKKQFLISDGNIIDDNRKKIYWKLTDKWEKRIIQFLTDTIDPSEILESELTVEQKQEILIQIEIDRIAALSAAEKENEKNQVLAGLLREAAIMKSELEIQDDPDALQKSQDWYNTEALKVEEKYS